MRGVGSIAVVMFSLATIGSAAAGASDETVAAKQVAATSVSRIDTTPVGGASDATGNEPRRLSDLAGNDDRAWRSANSVHPRLFVRHGR